MQLLAILINYKTPEMSLESLEAFLREASGRIDFRVIVVDNCSGDGSFAKLSASVAARGWGERVSVVETERNGGFAYGVNVGVRSVAASDDPPEFFYLLNSDAFPGPRAVESLLEFLRANPSVGIAGSFIHGPGGVSDAHITAFRFPSVLGDLESAMRLGVVTRLLKRWVVALDPLPSVATRVDWLAGASMMIRRRVFEDVGPFDDEFFLYYEETDFCRRALRRGWTTWYVPESRVMHIGSVSTGMKNVAKRMPDYWFASRAHYFRKNHGRVQLWAANLLWILGYSSWQARRRIQRKPEVDRPHLLADFIAAMFRRDGSRRPAPDRP
jgi:hypothetical protein